MDTRRSGPKHCASRTTAHVVRASRRCEGALLALPPDAGYNATSMPPKNGPPLVPGTLEGLERAITLLGDRSEAALRKKARAELQEFVGAYPNPAQAAAWKQVLTRMRKAKN